MAEQRGGSDPSVKKSKYTRPGVQAHCPAGSLLSAAPDIIRTICVCVCVSLSREYRSREQNVTSYALL